MTIDIPEGYEALGLALGEAVSQASRGKGADRHAEKGEPFSDQPILEIPRRLGEGGVCAPLYQAVKKIYESRRLPPDRARAELLGAINYLAAAWNLLGGAEGVFGGKPEPDGFDAPQTREELLKRIRDVNPAVYAPEDADMPRFREGDAVEFHDGSRWRRAVYMRPAPSCGAVLSCGGVPRTVSDDFVRKAPSAPEDADSPRFLKGELVEYRLPDGTWKPAGFMHMDGGCAVLVSGGEKVEVLAFDVRPAEKA